MRGAPGKPKSLEHRAKIAAALRGRKFSEAHKQALRDTPHDWLIVHGQAKRGRHSPTWKSWSSMIERCTQPNATRYNRYGGRGITVQPSWLSFEAFFKDMGMRPKGTTLDRIDNDGNYEAGNCRWSTVAVQNSNRVYSTACSPGCTCKRHRGRVFQGAA